MTTGQNMRRFRKERSLKQKELAQMAGIPVNTLCVYERDRSIPSLFNIIALADALGVSIDEYIGRTVKGGLNDETTDL